jgi:cytochrome c oxidase subunit 2
MVFRVQTPRRPRFAPLVPLVLVAAFASACAPTDRGNSLVPAGPAAAMENDLFNIIYIAAIVVFVAVEALLLWTTYRFRHRGRAMMPVQTHGNTRLEIAWTIAPTLVLAIIAVPTLTTIASATNVTPGPGTVTVQAIGHQFWWEFDYPDLGVVTADEMYIPVNTKVIVDVRTADVIHSFWVPKLGGKVQAIPNQSNTSWIQADTTGTFYAECFQLCGASHANMRFLVISESKADFDAWVAHMKQPAASPTSPQAQQGEQIFTKQNFNGQACFACHTVQGTSANAKVGPNLTHIGSHRTLAGATLQNTPQDLTTWLSNPPGVKPGSIMPNLHLTPEQINELVAYLQSLK